MTRRGILRNALKRGALLTAANWQVVIIQFVAEATFKLLLAIPILGGAFLVTLLLGQSLDELVAGDLREILAAATAALLARPAALIGFLTAFLVVLLGGSIIMFVVKAGTVSILVDADREAGPIERPPLRMTGFERAMRFSAARFTAGAARLWRRYVLLGFLLIGLYAVSVSLYALVVVRSYRVMAERSPSLGWTLATVLLSSLLIAWVTVVNVFYLLVQVGIGVTNRGVAGAFREVLRFLRADLRNVAGVLAFVLLLVVVATVLSLMATWGLGLIAFVPLAGLLVLPLQLGAWFIRSLLFQYLGLTALTAYLTLYRSRMTTPDEAAVSGAIRTSFASPDEQMP
jgi:hypothetical protein